jgi:hypothetical protein
MNTKRYPHPLMLGWLVRGQQSRLKHATHNE